MLFLVLALAPFIGAVKVQAEELVVTENGSGSTNQVQGEQTASVNVTQANKADVTNDVTVAGTTGDNFASDNSAGSAAVTTGDVSTNIGISNNTNGSAAVSGCCPNGIAQNGQAGISGNGSQSTNAISFTSSFKGNAAIKNTASVANSITGYLSTGSSRANDNNGNVSITTGNIAVSENIFNKVNAAFVSLGSRVNSDSVLKIYGNGTGSDNTITDDFSDTVVTAVNSQAQIFNNDFWKLVTGDNKANDNTGEVEIKTGDIQFEQNIENDANISVVAVTCCKKEEHKPEAVIPPEKPVSPKPGENNPGGTGGPGGSSKGDTLGAAIENSLPSTGNMVFYLTLAANIAMLILGTYIRLRSGRSPSVIAA